jgi:hypothetical protein
MDSTIPGRLSLTACANPPAFRLALKWKRCLTEKRNRLIGRGLEERKPPFKDYAALLAPLCGALFFRRFPVNCLDRSPAMSSMTRSSLPS